MIYFPKAAEPSALRDPRYDKILSDIAISLSSSSRRQQKFNFPLFSRNEIVSALLHESSGKCAYCERRIDIESGLIERFRPAQGAIDNSGNSSLEHYHRFAYEWSNFLAACKECSFAKGLKFPVASSRMPPEARFSSQDEVPMIINPTEIDPSLHIRYLRNGIMHGASRQGEVTVEILKLNRAELVQYRSALTDHFLQLGFVPKEHLSSSAEFAGLARSLAEQLSQPRTWVAPEISTTVNLVSAPDQEDTEIDEFFTSFPQMQRIEIEGIFGLNKISISIASELQDVATCAVILGENGTGKSSILRCVAIALYDGKLLSSLNIESNDILNPDSDSGRIVVTFDTGTVTVSVNRAQGILRDVRLKNGLTAHVLMLAYGATRLLPTERVAAPDEPIDSRALNLFDPYTPLRNPEEWLLGLSDEKFRQAAIALKLILDLPDDSQFIQSHKDSLIYLIQHRYANSINALSHGYKSIIGLACDIMATMLHRWGTAESSEGVVLLDEVESHLHPSWKLRIVGALRETFPRIQFIVTTHDPLCLRGFHDREVHVIRRSNDELGRQMVLSNLPETTKLRIDEILTSAFFGLSSTADPTISSTISEYYELIALQEPTPQQIERIANLHDRIRPLNSKALLERDEILYAAIDSFLARRDAEELIAGAEEEDGANVDELIEQLVGHLET